MHFIFGFLYIYCNNNNKYINKLMYICFASKKKYNKEDLKYFKPFSLSLEMKIKIDDQVKYKLCLQV